MRIQTEYLSFNNRWTISSSYDFQAHQQRSQRRCHFSQTALLWFEVLRDMLPALPGLSLALPGAPRLVIGSPRLVTGAPSYSEGRQEYPPRVWYSPEIDASKFTLHILSDTPGGFQWLKYILLLKRSWAVGILCNFLASSSLLSSKSFAVFVISNARSSPATIPVLAWANWLQTTILQTVSHMVFGCLQLISSCTRDQRSSTRTWYGMIENMLSATLHRSGYFDGVSCCWRLQWVISGIQNVLLIAIGSEW